MRIVTLEEHVIFPDLLQQYFPGMGKTQVSPILQQFGHLLADIEDQRLTTMNEQGISTQVLSIVEGGVESSDAGSRIAFARACNEQLASRISAYPGRFAAFAHLPMIAPDAAALELEYAVKELGFKGALISGMIGGLFLDDPTFGPVLEKAQALGVPLYLHPGPPPAAVYEAYFSRLPKTAGMQLAFSGWGWHSETAIHILRLILSGTLDRYPDLQLIIGHMGEMLPMMMARCDDKFKIQTAGLNRRAISQTLRDQVYITTSGLFTLPPLMTAIATFGIERILFSVDYPFSTNAVGRQFLDSLPLDEQDRQRLAYGNADRLLSLGGI
jgi:predicted TIM-barrel fold metal-dependent hydrolase